jgi:hypothetical protein
MSEREETGGTVIELLLREPDVAAWLEPAVSEHERSPDEDDEPPAAA